MTGDNLAHLMGGEIIPDAPSMEDITHMAGDFLQLVALSQDTPFDFDGCAMNIRFEPKTHKLLSITISPVDVIDGKQVVRDKQLSAEIDGIRAKQVL